MFVAGLDQSVTESQLTEYFDRYAAVISVKIVGQHVNKSKGFAFVEFLS